MKKLFLICLLTGCALGLSAQQVKSLMWEMQVYNGEKWEAIPDSQKITVEAGQEFQVAINQSSDSFCYVLIQDSGRKTAVLHNKSVKRGNGTVLDPLTGNSSGSGVKTLYVIMSLSKQSKLEDFLNKYKDNPDSQRHSNNLQGEVARLQEIASGLGEPSSVIIPTGGTTRGGSTGGFATRFSEKNMYVRVITINVVPADR